MDCGEQQPCEGETRGNCPVALFYVLCTALGPLTKNTDSWVFLGLLGSSTMTESWDTGDPQRRADFHLTGLAGIEAENREGLNVPGRTWLSPIPDFPRH